MKKDKILFVVGFCTLLILVIGAAYSYFQININNNTTDSSVVGTTNKYGTATFTTNTSKLYLKLANDEMGEDNQGTTYYANSDSTGTPLTTNPNYVLTTASLADGDLPLDCTYNFKVTATVTKSITDGSDSDVKITIGDTTKTLKELTSAGTNGVIISGTIKNLVTGANQTLGVSSILINTTSNQLGLSGNSYTITISPYTSGDTKSFSCELHKSPVLATYLIDNSNLWQSGLEGDGYRYVGSGAVGTETNPNNFICFGTTSKLDCTKSQDKYMYRILGVFPDASGNQHVKLIKYKQLGNYQWNDTSADVNWESSALYNGLNGSYFLTNSDFDYLQNNTWLYKIANWTWSAVNTKNSNYVAAMSSKELYLHEMNRSGKTIEVGSWTTPSAKIGLMYAGDYALSLGSSALTLTTGIYTNSDLLKTGWMHQSNNDTAKSQSEWTISSYSGDAAGFATWYVNANGYLYYYPSTASDAVRPTFYLNSTEKYSSGSGTLEDPFILEQ